jgi:hypothetical protein
MVALSQIIVESQDSHDVNKIRVVYLMRGERNTQLT